MVGTEANWRAWALSKGAIAAESQLIVATQGWRPSIAGTSQFSRNLGHLDFSVKAPNF